jgi:hypothetical protein
MTNLNRILVALCIVALSAPVAAAAVELTFCNVFSTGTYRDACVTGLAKYLLNSSGP